MLSNKPPREIKFFVNDIKMLKTIPFYLGFVLLSAVRILWTGLRGKCQAQSYGVQTSKIKTLDIICLEPTLFYGIKFSHVCFCTGTDSSNQ